MDMHRAAKRIIALAAAILTIIVGLGLSYLLALAGDPRSLWLVRDILGWV